MMISGKTRFPFTPTQWQELENQALIFKYMASGMPIPTHLIFSIKTSFDSSFLCSKFISHHPQNIGWNCFPIGRSGSKLDPEPGRCRRTDGKKWRCSNEAVSDSKYCERHRHRGKNRSRKPVEINSRTTNKNLSSIDTNSHPFINPHGMSSRPSSFHFSPENYSTDLFLDSGSYSQTNSDCSRNNRFVYGLKEDIDEHNFFSEPSGNIRSFSSSSMNDSLQLSPLTLSSSSSSSSSLKQRSSSAFQRECSYLQLQNFSKDSRQNKQDESCFKLDSDLGMKIESEPQKTIHHFFDESPLKNRDNWINLEDRSSVSTTQLSISTPKISLDFPIFNGRNNSNN